MKRTENPKHLQFEKQLDVVNEQLSAFQKQFAEKMLSLEKKYRTAQASNERLRNSLHSEREEKHELREKLQKLTTEHEALKTRVQRDAHALDIPRKDTEIARLQTSHQQLERDVLILSLLSGAHIDDHSLLTQDLCVQRNWNIAENLRRAAMVMRLEHAEFCFRFALCDSPDAQLDICFLPIQLTRRTGKNTELLHRVPAGAPEYMYYRIDISREELKYVLAGINTWFNSNINKLRQ